MKLISKLFDLLYDCRHQSIFNDNRMESNLYFGIKSKSFKLDNLVNRLYKHNKLKLLIIADLSKFLLLQEENDDGDEINNLDNRDLAIVIDQANKIIIDTNWIHREAINGIVLEEWIFSLNDKYNHNHQNHHSPSNNSSNERINSTDKKEREIEDQHTTPAEERGLRSFYSLLRLLPAFNISDIDLPITIKRQEVEDDDDEELQNEMITRAKGVFKDNSPRMKKEEKLNSTTITTTDTDIDGLVGLRKSLVFLEENHLTMETSNKIEIMIGNRLKIKCIWRIHGFLKLINKPLMDYSVSFENLSPSIIVTLPKKHGHYIGSLESIDKEREMEKMKRESRGREMENDQIEKKREREKSENYNYNYNLIRGGGMSLENEKGNFRIKRSDNRALSAGALFLKPKSKMSSIASSPLSSGGMGMGIGGVPGGRRHSTNTSIYSSSNSSLADASIIQYIRTMEQGRREELKSLSLENSNTSLLEERIKRLLSLEGELENEKLKDKKQDKNDNETITTESLIFQLKLF